MKLRAEIRIEIDASDFLDAADHQKAIQPYFLELRTRYPQATFELRARRSRAPSIPRENKQPLRVYTGNLALDDDG